MAISDTARRHHEELFPGHVSTLARTDPELVEYFDNFAFDEVAEHGSLDARTRLIVQLAALIACQALARVPGDAGRRAAVGVTPVRGQGDRLPGGAVRRDGQGVRLPARHQRGPHRRGVELPLPGQSTTTAQTRLARGRQVQGEVVGHDAVDAMYATRPPTWRTSSATCRPTASVTI